jgi:hypothetical protein
MPDPFFADLYRDTEHLIWPSSEQVRQRGRQRTRRTRMATGLAGVVAVALVATGAAALAGGPDGPPPVPLDSGSPTASPPPSPGPSPTTSPTGSPTPTTGATPSGTPPRTSSGPTSATGDPAIPAAAMLQLADLPQGFRLTGSDLDGDWSLEAAWAVLNCRSEPPSITPGQVARRGAVFDSPTANITQRVTRHSGGNAATSMERVRKLVTDCRPDRVGASVSILGEELAGEESLLVGSDIEGTQSRWLFVRQGDLVAQVWLGRGDVTPADVRPYAQAVADRLCTGTDAC